MLQLEEAQAAILKGITVMPSESVSLPAALGRFLAAPISAPADLPPFDNSAMDGYAVRAEDLAKASPDNPIRLRQVARLAAGELPAGHKLASGECVRVFTGSPMPPGADAVIMQEDTRADAEGFVLALDAIRPWENIRFCGEDVRAGTPLLLEGNRLGAAQIGLLAALGVSKISAARQPVLGVLATGNELLESGQPPSPGKIYESNRAALAALLAGLESFHAHIH